MEENENKLTEKNSTTASALPCIDKLREELSCAVRFLFFFNSILLLFLCFLLRH